MQEVVAPFALENLGCDGTEARLVDCPVVDIDEATAPTSYVFTSDYQYFQDYTNSAACDPFTDSYARIACGTSSAAGAGQLHTAPADSAHREVLQTTS